MPNKAYINHPIAIVVYVPIAVDEDVLTADGIALVDGKTVKTPVVVDAAKAESATKAIAEAAMSSGDVAAAFDALVIAVRGLEERVPGITAEGTAWFGAVGFSKI